MINNSNVNTNPHLFDRYITWGSELFGDIREKIYSGIPGKDNLLNHERIQDQIRHVPPEFHSQALNASVYLFLEAKDNIKNGFTQSGIRSFHYVTFEGISGAWPILNRRHLITDSTLIKEFLSETRGGKYLGLGEKNIITLIGEKNMLTCSYENHGKLRLPLEKTFTHRMINTKQIESNIAIFAKQTIDAFNNCKAVPHDNTYISSFVYRSLFYVLGLNLSNDELKIIQSRDKKGILTLISSEKNAEFFEKIKTFDDEEKVSTLLVLMAAGTETTEKSIKFFLQLLLYFPEFKEAIQKEMMQNGHFMDESSRVFDYLHDKNSLLHLCYLESLRLYPIVPVIHRIAKEDFKYGDTMIFKGDMLDLNIMASQRDQNVWGEDANKFNPLRFRDSEKAALLFNFSPGKTPCLGKHLAALEIKMMGLFFCKIMDLSLIDLDHLKKVHLCEFETLNDFKYDSQILNKSFVCQKK